MSQTPKTIQIFLPGGDPQGIRIAEITTRIVQVIEIPRSLIGEFLKMPESEQVGIYYLIGGSEGDNPKVYIGQTGELRKRLNQHNKDPNKDFWERALVLISRTNSLTTTHTLFLEWHSLQTVKQADRYTDENSTSGSNPHTPAPLEAECLEIFDTGKTLLATLGYPIFEPVAKTASTPEQEDMFYCKASGADGRGLFTQEGFVVLKGSIGRLESVPSFANTSSEESRQKLVDLSVMIEEGGKLVFTKDHLFKTPSMAATILLGRSANGWTEWKTETGHTLDQVKRQTP
jgi:predicted GIY-YIG superfamily endonuclease